MPSIFNSLSIGYSGLSAAQIGIDTTSHNISNAETDGYNRQRVVTAASTPLSTTSAYVGNGVEIQTIKRVFDNFVFDRYIDTYAKKEYSDLEQSTLEQLSTYFPEIDAVGVKADLQEYYNMWQSFSDNPDNDSVKLALAKQAEVLSDHIKYAQNQVTTLQSQLNEQLKVNVNEVNSLAKELAQINKSISIAEADGVLKANDLRDKRNVIERDLSRLIGAEINRGQLESNIQIDSSSNTANGSYTVSVNGVNIVDGGTYHPIHITNDRNAKGFYEISYESEDGSLTPLEEVVNSGRIGAILALRGGSIDTTSGLPVDGILQRTISEFDVFANGLIESTNNIYASTATTKMESNTLDMNPDAPLLASSLNIKEGSFNVVVYDIDGNITASREITIDATTTMRGAAGTNSIQAQMEAQTDDNADGNANNDIDDFINFNWTTFASGGNAVEFSLDSLSESRGFTFSIKDSLKDNTFSSGTNFAGALGMRKFFDGEDANSIDLNFQLQQNPTLISAGYTPISGDSRLALDMVQQQFEKYEFKIENNTFDNTIYGMFDIIATEVGTATNSAVMRNETISTQFNAVDMEYSSISKVSLDEEMTNLIKYQTSYGAAAKIITTIDQMMQTLLGIKQ